MAIPFSSFSVDFERDGGVWAKRPAPSGNTALSVTKRAISWFFDKNYIVGQYCTGDWWVLDDGGGVVINSITPEFSNDQNGTMINPTAQYTSPYPRGFDIRTDLHSYSVTTPSFPYIATAGQSICSSKSLVSLSDFRYTESIEILTVVSSIPAEDAFRPPYTDVPKNVEFRESSIDYSILQNLALPSGETAPDKAALALRFSYPQIDLSLAANEREGMPKLNCPDNYGRDLAWTAGEAFMALNLNDTQENKRDLAVNLIQWGIDNHGLLLTGTQFRADGGHMCARKLPTVFAAVALNDATMIANVDGANLKFQEDQQTFYISQTEVDVTNGVGWDPDDRNGTPTPYDVSMIGEPEWGIRHSYWDEKDNASWAAKYRYTASVGTFSTYVCAKLMGFESVWNHPAFFDFMEKWIAMQWPIGIVATIDDLPPGRQMPPDYTGGTTVDDVDHLAVALYYDHVKAF